MKLIWMFPLLLMLMQFPVDAAPSIGAQSKCGQMFAVPSFGIHRASFANGNIAASTPIEFLRQIRDSENSEAILTRLDVLDSKLVEQLELFEEVNIHEQARLIAAIELTGISVRDALSAVTTSRKLRDDQYMDTAKNFIDPTIYNVMRGHRIEAFVEIPLSGVSRAQGNFLNNIIETRAQVVKLDTSHPDIRRLQLAPGSNFFEQNENDTSNIVSVAGIPGLLRLLRKNPHHPAAISGEKARSEISAWITDKFIIVYISGIVSEPSGDSNEGTLTLNNGVSVEMSNVRLINIVGADTTELLKRESDEIYLRRPVRIWIQDLGRWEEGVIVDPDGPHNWIVIATNRVVNSNLNFHGGRGYTVVRDSLDVDLRDPVTSEPLIHPLQFYPQIKHGALVKVRVDDGQFDYGYINGINSRNSKFYLRDERRLTRVLEFDSKYDLIDTTDVPDDLPIARKGNRVVVFNYKYQRELVYEILGYDRVADIIIGKILNVDLNDSSVPHLERFIRNDSKLIFLENDNFQLYKKFPELVNFLEHESGRVITFKIGRDSTIAGTILTINTLPRYIRVIVKKTPEELAISENGDMYNRFDVYPDQIVRIMKR